MTVGSAAYLKVDYDYTFVQTNANGGIVLPSEGNVGYEWGDNLLLMFRDTTANTFHKMPNPINLAFRKPDGTCRTAISDAAGDSFVELKFGQNQIFSCAGSSNFLYVNLIQIFNYLGRYGISDGVLADYIALTIPSTAITIA